MWDIYPVVSAEPYHVGWTEQAAQWWWARGGGAAAAGGGVGGLHW